MTYVSANKSDKHKFIYNNVGQDHPVSMDLQKS
jgi:hypothetical protein